jgi:hypothetical protein
LDEEGELDNEADDFDFDDEMGFKSRRDSDPHSVISGTGAESGSPMAI